jgi:hypothetical protein
MKSSDAQMELVRRYLSGEATGDEARSLEALLAADAQLRRDFLAYARMDAHLSALARPSLVNSTTTTRTTTARQRMRPWMRIALASLAAVAVVLVAFAWWSVPQSAAELGTITQVLNLEPIGEGTAPAVGQRLQAGRVVLNRGAMEIRLSNGVMLLCEGPGELELLSAMRVLLRSGQVVVRVPQEALGFQVDAPSARVVDLGTEFAMKAGPGLETDVQVFHGVVEASPQQGGFASRLKAGHAARFTPAAARPRELPYSESRFLRRIPIEPGVPLPGHGDDHFRPARHSEVVIPKRDTEIVVDGDLSEWSAEGRFFSQRDSERSVEGRMRHDASAFYLAAHIKDPAPMHNNIDPTMDGERGWRGGGLQVRLSLDRALGWPVDASSPSYYRMRHLEPTPEQIARAENNRLVSMTLWHHEPSATACLHVATGFDYDNGVVNPPGYTAVFQRDTDGAGYTLEARVPWSLLGVQDDPPRAGDALAICWQTHWSDPSGRVWLTDLVELRNPTEPLRIFSFERATTWGRALYK